MVKVFHGEKGIWAFIGEFYPASKEEMPFKNWNEAIRNVFLASLKAAVDVKPNTPEWELIWNSLYTYKTYAESKEKE